MKLFLVLLFIGCASATLHDALGKASEEVLESMREAMDQAQPLHEVLGIEENAVLNRFERDVKQDLIDHIEKLFKDTITKIDEAIKNGKTVNKEAYDRLKKLKEDLKELEVGEHELDVFKDHVGVVLRQILEKMGIFEKRSVDDPLESMLGDLSFRDFFLKIKQTILEKMDVSALKLGLTKAVKQASQGLCRWLTNKGEEKLLNFFDRALESDESEQSRKRSVSDLYDHLKDYFEDLHIDFREKFAKFGEWLKQVVETSLDKSRDKIENVRVVARELINKSKTISKEVAAEALEFLHRYKEELGHLYDEAREKVMKKIMDYTD